MTSTTQAAKSKTPAKAEAQTSVAIGSQAILDTFTNLVTSIPVAPEDDGLGMILRILEVETWDELQESGKLPSSKDLVGQEVLVTNLWRKPSDKPSATGFYLLCERTDKRTGEASMFTAGGQQSVAVLAKLYQLDVLPALVVFESVVTRSGNDAINCVVKSASPKNA